MMMMMMMMMMVVVCNALTAIPMSLSQAYACVNKHLFTVTVKAHQLAL
jgi:hypothetical protein